MLSKFRRAASPLRPHDSTSRNFPFYKQLIMAFCRINRSGTSVALSSARSERFFEEKIMRVHVGSNLLVLEMNKSLFAWFQGETERMRLTSMCLMFVQLSVFAQRSPAF
jgi:hypothetical protein